MPSQCVGQVRRERNTANTRRRSDASGGIDVTIALSDRRAASRSRGERERGRLGVRLGGRRCGGPDHLSGDFDCCGRRLELSQQAADLAVAVVRLRRVLRAGTAGLSSCGIATAVAVVAKEACVVATKLAAGSVTAAAEAHQPVKPVAHRRQEDVTHRQHSRDRPEGEATTGGATEHDVRLRDSALVRPTRAAGRGASGLWRQSRRPPDSGQPKKPARKSGSVTPRTFATPFPSLEEADKLRCSGPKSPAAAPLAQSAEQLTLNQWVLGSSPRGSTENATESGTERK